MVMMGATSMPAAPAESASTPMRRPNFDVFHSRGGVELEVAGDRIPGIGTLGFGMAIEGVATLASFARAAAFRLLACSSPIAASSGG